MDIIDRYLDLLGQNRAASRLFNDPGYLMDELDVAYNCIPEDRIAELEAKYKSWAENLDKRIEAPTDLYMDDVVVAVGDSKSPRIDILK